MVISAMCISFMARFMNSMGQGEPAMMPVRRVLKSKRLKNLCSSMLMNMVGTP